MPFVHELLVGGDNVGVVFVVLGADCLSETGHGLQDEFEFAIDDEVINQLHVLCEFLIVGFDCGLLGVGHGLIRVISDQKRFSLHSRA